MASALLSFHRMIEHLVERPNIEMGSKICHFPTWNKYPEDICLYITKIWQSYCSCDHFPHKLQTTSLAFPSLQFFISRASNVCPSLEQVTRMWKPLCSLKHQVMFCNRDSAQLIYRLTKYKMGLLENMLWHQTWTMVLIHNLLLSSFLEVLKDSKWLCGSNDPLCKGAKSLIYQQLFFFKICIYILNIPPYLFAWKQLQNVGFLAGKK